ncbi:DNA methylase N-4/N-6 domain protein [Thermodesulfobacterium geofontis OPF15]|uniref:Methyltransferase n=1 Tax=Thermodesulfobacterium geofontis (strain OPF15) TaxID=795359 RepID=F8C692_THEGP|nr:DNA methyltransferase [Thermodesulfobacterium geofontis]AEH23247.1 DNA methylase N-4/N-6 domain protein [Thermodesulfobacterium geofontis OPF15]
MIPWAKIIIGDSRKMVEIKDESIDLIVTSPPYWHIKDYGKVGQIGYGQTLHEYLKDLYRVWEECFRVLKSGRRLCINIGDQFARSVIYGRYKIIPLHAEVISQCERIGFDYMGAIIWQKKTTMNTTGGAVVMGSYPYPPNGMIEIDYEFILVFKKPGTVGKVPKEIKENSKLTKEEWKEYFAGHWGFGGEKQINHEAMFPEELPKRLIKMYSFIGDTVLDPFVGSGTTVKVALELKRNAVGYEINENFLEIIKEKMGIKNSLLRVYDVEIIKRNEKIKLNNVNYKPSIQDAKPQLDPKKLNFRKNALYKVVDIVDENTIKLNTGLLVKFLGVNIVDKDRAIKYLKEYLLKKEVMLRLESNSVLNKNTIFAYVYLKNKIFINAYLIKSGIAQADREKEYKLKRKFLELEKETKCG